jgi:DNA modification methylase
MCGSGTTFHAAKKWGQRFLGCDIRADQVDIARRRVAGITPVFQEMAK